MVTRDPTGQSRKGWFAYAVSIVLLTWTILESVWTILKTLQDGVTTYQYPFIITGSFHDPASFGAFIAIGLAIAVASIVRLHDKKDLFSKIQYYLSIIALLPGAIVLIVSRSRAAWVGLIVAVAFLLFQETNFKRWICKRQVRAIVAAGIILLAGIGMFMMKKDSAIGRFHIWNMECRVIAAHPWTGVGFDKIFKTYGDVQSAYFQQSERPETIVRVAGSPVYAFNEYLKFGMAWGIGGLLLSIAAAAWVVWRMFRKQAVLAYGALVYALFAFASYPLSVVQLKWVGILLLAVALAPEKKRQPWWLLTIWGIALCACVFAVVRAYPAEKSRRDAERTWRSSFLLKEDTDALIARLQPLYPSLHKNVLYLYQYGYLLRQSGAFEESNNVLQQGADISCDPVFHTVMAQNHIDLGNDEMAEAELLKAHWLGPGRISPLLMLMRLYADSGRTTEAVELGRTIQKMPVYENSPEMEALYGEAIELLNELE